MKNLKNYLKKSALAMSIIALSSTQAFAGAGTVSFKLVASDGTTGVSGAAVQYFKSGQQLLGYTNDDGVFSIEINDIPGTTTFYIRPANGGVRTWTNIDPASNPTLTAQMVAVTINLNSSTGTPLAGNALYFGPTGWTNIGSTPATIDLLPSTGLVSGQGAYDFRTSFEGRTSVTLRQDIASNSTVNFNTTLVHMDYNKTIQYYNNGGWQNFQSPKEMLGGTQNFPNNNVGRAEFRFRDGSTTIHQQYYDITGTNVYGGIGTQLTVKNENGQPISGVSFQPACGGTWQSVLPKVTNAGGIAFVDMPTCMTKIKVRLGNSAAEFTKAEIIALNYTFTAEIVRLKLIDNSGIAIADQTGTASQGGGTWINLGSLDANGSVLVNTFPTNSGQYRMTYNCNSQTKSNIVITAGAGIEEIVWQTGMVVSTCGHTQYQGCGWSTFISGMQQLPGTRTFRNPSVTKTVVAGQILNLCDDNANPIFGGSNDDDFSEYDNNNSPVSDMKNNVIADVVSVYPNPSSDYFNISIETSENTKSHTSVVNISGKELFNFNSVGSTTYKVETSTLSSGIYFVLTNINGKVTSTKLVVNN